MEQKVILKTDKQCTFYINDNNISFYLVIPNSKRVNLLLSIYEGVNDEMVKNLEQEPQKALIIPVLDNQLLADANFLNELAIKRLDSIMSYLINKAYKILSCNHIEVEQKILILNNPRYYNYIKRYSVVFASRVELYNQVPDEVSTLTKETVPPVNQEEVKPEIIPVEEPKPEVTTINSPSPKDDRRELGFVSYVLLGVLVAVISLVFLYLIL